MKKIFNLFDPEKLSFRKKSIEFPPAFIKNYSEPILYYSTLGLDLIKDLDQTLKEDLRIQDRTLLKNCVAKEILPYLFCYQFEDQYKNGTEQRDFEDYIERRRFYEKLKEDNPDLHEVVSYNKYRKRKIEPVLRYAKHFGMTNQTIRIRSLVEQHYDLDNPYKFQTEDWNLKYRVAEAVCELAVELTKEIILDVKQKIAA